MEVGVTVLPQMPKDAGDRNRTSPFAFTGNKFEFRAVGSSFSIAGPNIVLNTIVAESLDYMATELEAATKAGKTLAQATGDLLPAILKESMKVVFNGDGYSQEWHDEAAKRGLPNLKNTIDSLPTLVDKKSVDLFAKYKVLSERELMSRYNIFSEEYAKTLNIEALTMLGMAKTMILPAAIRYQGEVAESLSAVKAAGVDVGGQADGLKSLSGLIGDFQAAIAGLEHAAEHTGDGDAFSHAKYMRDSVLPKMEELRVIGDKLEMVVADDLWPLPKYQEMLFIK